jgi:hypothetical protein
LKTSKNEDNTWFGKGSIKDIKIIGDYNVSLKIGLIEKGTAQKNITFEDEQRIDKTDIIRK